MKFVNLVKKNETNKSSAEKINITMETKESILQEEKKKPEELLRSNGIKIRLVTPTSFGTQFDLAKIYDEDELKDLLKDYTIKIKGKSLFIVD